MVSPLIREKITKYCSFDFIADVLSDFVSRSAMRCGHIRAKRHKSGSHTSGGLRRLVRAPQILPRWPASPDLLRPRAPVLSHLRLARSVPAGPGPGHRA